MILSTLFLWRKNIAFVTWENSWVDDDDDDDYVLQEAVKSALFDTEFDSPIWAVVVVNQMDPLNGKVDYKIRMNFTTVPHTWSTIHKHRIGLLTYYKHYYTSGFLSLQVQHCFEKSQFLWKLCWVKSLRDFSN
jgi:hypothetical protein